MKSSNEKFSDRDIKFINMAEKLARDSVPYAGARVSAIIAHRGEILSFGFNGSKTHPFQARYCKNPHAVYWHAETHAIRNTIKNNNEHLLSKSTMYVLRLTTGGRPALSMPCEGCAKAIETYKVGRVLYTTGLPYSRGIHMERFAIK